MTIIKSKKFILRPLKKGDEFAITKNINDKEISKNTSTIPYPYELKDAKWWVAKTLKESKVKNPKDVLFEIDIAGEVVGAIGLHKIEAGHKAEMGYWLGRNYWGQGIMSEAIKMVTKFGFQKLKLKRIYAHVFLFNPASKKVLEKNGFVLEGINRKDAKKGNKFLDHYTLAKVR